MAFESRNLAYDLSLFEEQPKKYQRTNKNKNNILNIPKERLEYNARKKINVASVLSKAALLTVSISVVTVMVHSQVQLTELTDELTHAKKALNESQSIYTQLQMKVESQLSLRTVEEYARAEMGMKKTEPYQVEYISLSDGDKAQIVNSGNKFLEMIKNLI